MHSKCVWSLVFTRFEYSTSQFPVSIIMDSLNFPLIYHPKEGNGNCVGVAMSSHSSEFVVHSVLEHVDYMMRSQVVA